MQDCATCNESARLEPVPRWKAPLVFVGALFFCPCHLPVTFAVLAAAGGGVTGLAWFFGNKVLVYSVFSGVYLVLMVFLVRWFIAGRDRERALEALHQGHAAQDS